VGRPRRTELAPFTVLSPFMSAHPSFDRANRGERTGREDRSRWARSSSRSTYCACA